MKGLLRKIFLEVRIPVLLFSTALALVMFLLTSLLPKVLGSMDTFILKMPFIKPLLSAFIGQDIEGGFTTEMMQGFLWIHPSVLALVWAHELMYCSRMPAAEIDRGTIDFLLGLPISRWKLYLSETIGWIVSGLVIVGSGLSGHLLASSAQQHGMRPGLYAIACIGVNFFAVYLAVGSLAFLISANSDRRGRTIGVMFAVLLASFLLNFLAQFWKPAQSFSFLSVMEYYRPAYIIQSSAFPWTDVAILLFISIASWTAGGLRLRSRSVCTV